MSHYLLCSSPIYGHAVVMAAIGRDLVARGHSVTFYTGARFAEFARAGGMHHRPIPAESDYDDRDLDKAFPARLALKGLEQLKWDMTNVFAAPIPHHARGLRALLKEQTFDAILAECMFFGVVPILQSMAPGTRPPVVWIGEIPMTMTSVDCAPFGMGLQPGRGPLAKLRNRVLNLLITKGAFGAVQRSFVSRIREAGGSGLDRFFLDVAGLAERHIQLTSRSFEFPRREMPGTVVFAGPLVMDMRASHPTEPLSWWGELDGTRPVVHVTQGTIDNLDFGRLIRPTLAALAERDVLVVVTTGGRLVELLGQLPANARAAEFIPYEELLPKVDVMVTNGGYGGVHHALQHGIPLAVAGGSEDKPDVAARVEWSGAGINLHTGTPTAKALAKAIDALLSDARYREAARRLSTDLSATNAHDIIEMTLEELTDASWPPHPAAVGRDRAGERRAPSDLLGPATV